ncbi:MAG: hypothetical protein KAV87_23165 [Desulfobacteraceae bacterium]|nr:hypothetical protein [Desulfobacteraceae bacterium]
MYMPLDLLLPPDQFYTKLQAGPVLEQLYERGQFFWAPTLFAFGKKPVHLIKGKYSRNTGQWEYRVAQMGETEFESREQPIQPLGIQSDQRAAIVGCKLRPVILLSQHPEKWKDGRRTYDETYLVAPVYSFERYEGKQPYSPAFIERMKGFIYNTFFYLPESTSPRFTEGFARFDKIQAIHRDQLRHMPIMLKGDALWLLLSWLSCFIGAELDKVNDVLFDYREESIQALKEAKLL